jgi:hypothetical protein
MKQKNLEKLACKGEGVNLEEHKESSGNTHGGQYTSSKKVSTYTTKNVAILARVVVVVGV